MQTERAFEPLYLASIVVASIVVVAGLAACVDDDGATDTTTETSSDVAGDLGDGDPGDGDGDPGDPGDGDGDPGDGDGDPGDGDGDPGDGDGDLGDGDGDPGDGDGDPGDGDGDPGDGDPGDGDGDGDGDPGDGDGDPGVCGDGILDDAEACDDGNDDDADACDSDCMLGPGAIKVSRGLRFTCLLTADGRVKCWGTGNNGVLGQGNFLTIGDNELPSSIDFIDLGGTAVDVEAGGYHVCALMDDASVRCWGQGLHGQLGYGNSNSIGDTEVPASVGPVDVGDDVVALGLGQSHTCALTDQQTVRCWGYNGIGVLGLGPGEPDNVGDDEVPASVGPVAVGGPVIDLAVGFYHSCVLLEGGDVRCWGFNQVGELGQGNFEYIGDNELPESVEVVSLGEVPVVDLSAGSYHTCALHQNGDVRCWGSNGAGQLGLGLGFFFGNLGDDELPSSVPPLDIGAPIDEIAAGDSNTCIRIGPEIKCWGAATGINGTGTGLVLGFTESPAAIDPIDIGFDVSALSTGSIGFHMCALSGSALRCWGAGSNGALGYGNTETIGDDELPSSVGLVSYL